MQGYYPNEPVDLRLEQRQFVYEPLMVETAAVRVFAICRRRYYSKSAGDRGQKRQIPATGRGDGGESLSQN